MAVRRVTIEESALRRSLAWRLSNRASLGRLCALLALLTFLATCLATGFTSSLAGELDDARLSRIWPGAAHYRWENLEGAPQWVAGVRPMYRLQHELDAVDLNPGESTTFRIPPRGAIRVVGVGGRLAPHEVELWVSNGSGLYQRQLTAINQCDGSLIAVPDMADVGLAQVVRSAHCKSPIRVAIYTSRLLSAEFIDGHRCEIAACGQPVKLSDSRLGPLESSRYWQLSPGGQACLTVTGPVRLQLATRYLFTETDAAHRQMYRVYIVGPGGRRALEYITSSDQRRHVHLDGCQQLVGEREVAYVDVPPGTHRYTFDASACVLLQARVLGCAMYRNPCYNSPRYFPRQARPNGRPDTLDSLWQIPSSDVAWFLRHDPTDVVAQSALALRSARDNRYRQGGLRASMMMLAAAAARPEEPTVRSFADELRRHGSLFRPLLPRWQGQPIQPQAAYYLPRALRNPEHMDVDVIIGEQLIGDSLASTQGGHFQAVANNWGDAGEYVLPHDLGPSLLRVVVDKSSINCATRLFVQLDEQKPIPLIALPGCELQLGDYYPSRPEAALAALQWAHGVYDSGTLGGPFAAWNKAPARLVATGNCELVLPGGVHAVRIWAATESPRRPRVALAYRTSRPYRLTEAAYYDALHRVHCEPSVLLEALVQRKQLPSGDPFAAEEIRNHYEPLVRMLHDLHDNVQATVFVPSAAAQAMTAEWTMTEAETATALATARQLVSSQQWLPALERWAELTHAPSESVRRQARLGRVEALIQLNELQLAKNQLLGILFTNDDYILEQMAYERMIELLVHEQDDAALERFLAAMVVRKTTPARVIDLAELLLTNGRFAEALQLMLLVPPELRSAETILRAAYQTAWWRTFDNTVTTLAPAEASFWSTLKRLKWGSVAEAKAQFVAAGPQGQAWLNHLQLGEQIAKRLSQTDATARACAVHAWEAWQAHHPGPRTWREEGALISSCPGTASVYSVGRDRYGQFYATEPGNPLQLTVHGPVDLKFEVRPLHPAGSIEAQDDWLSIESTTAAAVWPITANRTSPGWEIVGQADQAVGRRVFAYLRLGPGRHELNLAAERLSALVRVFAARPEIHLPVLPPVNSDTLAAVESGLFQRPTLAKYRWRRNRTHIAHNVVAHILPRGCREARHAPFVQFGPHSLDEPCEPPTVATCDDSCALCAAVANRLCAEPTCGQASPTCSGNSYAEGHLAAGNVSSLTQMPGWSAYENTPWRFQMSRAGGSRFRSGAGRALRKRPVGGPPKNGTVGVLGRIESQPV